MTRRQDGRSANRSQMMELLEVMNDIKLRCILRHCRIRNLRAVLVAHWPTAKGFLIHAPLSSQNAQNSRSRNDYGSFGNGFSIARTDRNRRVNPLVFTHLFVSPPNPEHQPHYQLPTMTTLHTSASELRASRSGRGICRTDQDLSRGERQSGPSVTASQGLSGKQVTIKR